MNTGEWISATIAVVALIVAVIALCVAARATRTARASIPVSAARPARSSAGPEAPPPTPSRPAGVAWAIEHDGGITWRLRNVGTEPAYDVNAVGLPDESASLVRLSQSFTDVPVDGSVGFHVVRTAHHPTVTGLAVTWGGRDEPVVVAMLDRPS